MIRLADPVWDDCDIPLLPPDEPWLMDAWYAAIIHDYTIDWIFGNFHYWPPLRELTR